MYSNLDFRAAYWKSRYKYLLMNDLFDEAKLAYNEWEKATDEIKRSKQLQLLDEMYKPLNN